MRWMLGASVRSKGLVVALGIGVLFLGVTQLRDMPRDVLPEFGPPTVEVQTEALGLSAEEVEQLVTTPLEQDLLNGVAFLDVIRSESLPGLSRIELVFDAGTPVARARQVVNERLTQAHALPAVADTPQMLQPVSSTSRVMMVRLSSEQRSLIDLSLLARWSIRPRLMGVPGVANVAVWGQREHQLQVQVDPARLQAAGVTLDQVIRTTGNSLWVSPLTFLEASTPGAGGFYDTPSQRIGVEHIQPIKTPEDLAKVIIDPGETAAAEPQPASTARSGRPDAEGTTPAPKRLGDVTNVTVDHQPLIGDAVFTDGPGLLIVVEKLPEANAVEVTEALEDAVNGLRPGLAGVDVDTSFFKPARYVEDSQANLRTALLIGLVLLAVALALLMFDLRAALVAVAGIFVSLAAAVLVVEARGATLNAVVLGGLVLALFVTIDDAVITADGGRRRGPARSLVAAVLRARGPLAYGTAILLVALMPLYVLGDEAGAFLPRFATTYALAVLVSLVVALTFTPALASLVIRSRTDARISPAFGWLRPRLDRLSSRIERGPRAGLGVAAVLLLLALVVLPFLERGDSIVPEFKDRDLLIQWSGAPGTSLPEMRRIAARAGNELRELPGVDNVGGHVGRAVLGDQVVGVNASELWVSLESSADYDETVSAVEGVVTGYPGIERSVLTYPRARIQDELHRPDGIKGKDLTVRVFGSTNLETLRSTAERVRDAMGSVEGAQDAVIEVAPQEPVLQVRVDLDKAQALGIKPGDVRRSAATMLSGIRAGLLFEQQKVFDVMVWGTPETRGTVETVRNLRIDKPDGGQVALSEVADVEVTPSPVSIRHDSSSRAIDVGVDVGGPGIDAVAADIREAVRDIDFPIEYHAELLGDFEEHQAARNRFVVMILGAAVGIFLLLQAATGSWKMAAVSFAALPGALSGAFVAAWLDGDPVTIGTLIGFLAVLGLAARHLVLFVRESHALEDVDARPFGSELVRQTAHERLMPTVIGAVAIAVVCLPLLLMGGRAGLEIVSPMAGVVLGGVVTTTLFSLLILPSLYLHFGFRPEDSREQYDTFADLATADDGTRPMSTIDA